MIPSEETFSIDCDVLEANTLVNPSWPLGYDDLVYRYPGVPDTGTVLRSLRDLCSIRTPEDAQAKAVALRETIFGQPDIPSGMTLSGPNPIGDHEEFVVRMPYWGDLPGMDSHVWVYRPYVASNGVLLLIHGGHADHGPIHADLVDIREEARSMGITCAVLSMPGNGPNNATPPMGYTANANPGYLAAHQAIAECDLKYMTQDNWGSPVLGADGVTRGGIPPTSGWYAFVWPVHCILNKLAPSFQYIAATGLSGGAATLLVATALDERIRAYYHVAGSGVPTQAIYHVAANFGDAENQVSTILGTANYEEQNLMACSGGRRVIHILNDSTPGDGLADDPGAFSQVDVNRYGRAIAYDSRAIVGGSWDYYVAPNPSHTWSSPVRGMILRDVMQLAHRAARPNYLDPVMKTKYENTSR